VATGRFLASAATFELQRLAPVAILNSKDKAGRGLDAAAS
jgi:hypothetical protein